MRRGSDAIYSPGVSTLHKLSSSAVSGLRVEAANRFLVRVWPWLLALCFVVALVWELGWDLQWRPALLLLAATLLSALGLWGMAWLRRPDAGAAMLVLEGRAGTNEQLLTALSLSGQSGPLVATTANRPPTAGG